MAKAEEIFIESERLIQMPTIDILYNIYYLRFGIRFSLLMI